MDQLADVYSSLFAQTTTQNDETDPLSHRNTQYPKMLLQKYRGRTSVLLQLSIYRKLFSPSITNMLPDRDNLHDQITTEMAVSHTRESGKLDMCQRLATEAESVINIMVGYLMSGDQFISFAASKALASFIMYIYIITDSQSIEVFLKWINHLISVETFQTHVAVYTLQTFTDVLKPVRKTKNKVQGSATSLWVCVNGFLKHSLQLLKQVKELYKQLGEQAKDRKCRIKWVELSVDTLLCLSTETLRHVNMSAGHMTTSVCHMITSADHITSTYEFREVIHHNLLELTSFLDFSQSTYVLKEVIRLNQKILTGSFPQKYDSLLIRTSLLKLFQSDIFTRTARSWLRSISPTELNTKAQALDTTSHSSLLHSSMTESNEQGLTLESGLISTIMRKGVLLLLRYSASVLATHKKSTWTAGCVQLEELLSLVAQKLYLPSIVDLSPSIMATAQHQLLELLSEQDGCLIEGLLLSCNITKTLKESSSLMSLSSHPTLNVCLRLVHVHSLFIEFLSSFIFFDHSILIDYFISPETSTTFRQFLSQYLSLAVGDWMTVAQACKELDDRNSEIIPSTSKLSNSADISKDEEFKDHSPTLSLEEITTKHPQLALNSVLPSCEEVDSRSKPEMIRADFDTLKSTSTLKRKLCLEHAGEDLPASLNLGQTATKQPKLESDSSLSTEDDTTISPALYSHQRISVGEKCPRQTQDDKESSNSEIVELESSDSVYVETSLDKMMDCITQFKYSLQRLECSHLLKTINDSDSTVENIICSFERLEDLYEAMEKYL